MIDESPWKLALIYILYRSNYGILCNFCSWVLNCVCIFSKKEKLHFVVKRSWMQSYSMQPVKKTESIFRCCAWNEPPVNLVLQLSVKRHCSDQFILAMKLLSHYLCIQKRLFLWKNVIIHQQFERSRKKLLTNRELSNLHFPGAAWKTKPLIF